MPNPFEGVPDSLSRAALEEIFAPGFCKTVLGEYAPRGGAHDPNPEFPPEPAEILTVTFAYLRPGAPGGIKQEFAALTDALPSDSAAVRLHRGSIDSRHRAMPYLLEIADAAPVPGLQSTYQIRQFCIDAVRRQGRTLLAAHMIARLGRNGALVDTLVMPREVSEGIPLRIRDAIVPFAFQLPPDDPLIEAARGLLQGSPDARESAAIATASFLPKSDVLRAALQTAREHWRRARP